MINWHVCHFCKTIWTKPKPLTNQVPIKKKLLESIENREKAKCFAKLILIELFDVYLDQI